MRLMHFQAYFSSGHVVVFAQSIEASRQSDNADM